MASIAPGATVTACCVWLTGPPGAGKRTIAHGVRDALSARGVDAALLAAQLKQVFQLRSSLRTAAYDASSFRGLHAAVTGEQPGSGVLAYMSGDERPQPHASNSAAKDSLFTIHSDVTPAESTMLHRGTGAAKLCPRWHQAAPSTSR